MLSVVLKKGRERSVLRRHPWIFSGAIDQVEESLAPGDTVEVMDADGQCLGRGAWSPESQINVRMWTFDPATPVDGAFFRAKLEQAIGMRGIDWSVSPKAARRLVNSESDGLPGLIVDRYAGFLVCQFLTVGADKWRGEIVAALSELCKCDGIFERSDADERGKEGLEEKTGLLAGAEPPESIEIEESGLKFLVNARDGHKTGFYLDQRKNRSAVREVAAGADVLDCFCYSGGFTTNALKGGAEHVTSVDSSGPALDLLERNVKLNGLDAAKLERTEGDVFHVLRKFRDVNRSFSLVILDPPKFVASKGSIEKACRGYKDINLLGIKLLRPGGTLVTFSCSGLLERELFHKLVADAAVDAKRDVRVVRILGQAPDHPFTATFPEGNYLKGLVCRVW